MRPSANATSPAERRDARRGPAQPGGTRVTRRRIAAGALYHAGLLGVADRLAAAYDLKRRHDSSFPRLQRTAGSKFAILCYHRVGTEGVPLFSRLAPKMFEAQMRHVRRHYRVVSLSQMRREIQEGTPVGPTVTVTFDDGYRDLYKHAFPVLRRYEIPATIYLIGRCMETGEAPWYDRIFVALAACSRAVLEVELDSPRRFLLASPEQRAAAAWEIVTYLREVPNRQRLAWCAAFDRDVQVPQEELEGRMLDWQQVRAMARGGVFFGAHTMTHPVLSRLEASSLDAELSASKQLLESGLDASVEDFAYPFGKPEDCSREAEEAIRRCGYKSAVNTSPGLNTGGSNPHALYRYQIDEEDSLACFAFDLSRLFLEGPAPAPSAGQRSASEAHAVGAGARAERIGS